MASQFQNQQQSLHFLLFPLISQSHIIPMTHFAKLLALSGVTVSIITTPLNAARYKSIVDRAAKANLKIQIIPLRFPCQEAGLPEGCENLDGLSSSDMVVKFFAGCSLLRQPLEELLGKLNPPPSCIITSTVLYWTRDVADKFGIPRYNFHTVSCFTLFCDQSLLRSRVHEAVESDSEPFLVPEMPDRIEFTRSQLPDPLKKKSYDSNGMLRQIRDAEKAAQGNLMNSFEELEKSYVEGYKNIMGKVWCVGPVAMCNQIKLGKFDCDNNKGVNDEHQCLKWLDSMKQSSVVYACFGSLCRISPSQLMEIGLGLEASNKPFIWVIRAQDLSIEVEKWLAQEKFEERVKGRGLVIRGWAPQVQILAHLSVGGFLTHCGWNSTMEGVCAGVPMITWPMSAEQFFNEKLVVDVLKIGLSLGVKTGMMAGVEEKNGAMVKKEQVKDAIEKLMDKGVKGKERRRRAKDLGETARGALEEGGSSYSNITKFIEDVIQFTG